MHLIQYYSLHTIPGSYNTCCFDFGTVQGDVYPVESYESLSANHVLDAHWGVLDDDDDVSIEISIMRFSFSATWTLLICSAHNCILNLIIM